MAILPRYFCAKSLCFISLLFSTATHLALAIPDDDVEGISLIPIDSIKTVFDILPQYGLPKGLLPDAVKSYSLSDSGDFEVELERSCYVHFDELVYYDKKITGKLTYGSVSDVTGIQAKKLFLWVPVTGIEADSDSGLIEFHVGFLSEKLPAEQFQTIPTCKSNSYQETSLLSSLIPEW